MIRGCYKFKKSGDQYTGEWNEEDGKRNGQGEYLFSNGASYTGEWVADQKHGKGVFLFHKLQENGSFSKDSVDESKGLYIWGERYEGDWKNDEMEGKGCLKMLNGDVFVGEFSKDHIFGKGIFHRKNANETYEGIWQFKGNEGTLLTRNGEKFYISIEKDGNWDFEKEETF